MTTSVFPEKKVVEIKVSEALKQIETIFDDLDAKATTFGNDQAVKMGKQETPSGSVMSHLMAGVSAALPFVIGGGLLVAIANMLVQFGMPYTDMANGDPSFTWIVESIGYLGFKFMIPIMGLILPVPLGINPHLHPHF
ncbi:PTS subunit IIBC [Listeria fleischmannii subsp. fleischmannii LU2006-1]|nr:PTS subunit IIBC [Listeria fleischmannii subsp. fleischmannii LU2006-1]